MFEYLFGTTFNVSLAELIGSMCFGAVLTLLLVAIILGTKWMPRWARDVPVPAESVPASEPMVVIPANGRQVDDEPGVRPGPGWRRSLALEATPLVPVLPDHESVWRYDDWKLDDPDRTQMWPVVEGVDAMDVDPGPEPKVDPNTRGRFVRSDAELSAMAAALGFEAKDAPRRHYAAVDAALAEAAERLSKGKSKAVSR